MSGAMTGPLRDVLLDLRVVVAALTPAHYGARPPGFPSTIGAQVRHCIDHVRAFVDGSACGLIDYERRERGTAIELVPEQALSALDALRDRLARPAAEPGDAARVVDRLDPSRPPIEMMSTIGRELHFVTSHTTHHSALIGAMAGAFGVAMPPRFGFAASTLAFLDRMTCAP